jgi:pyrroline-5-carboxylate reductase
VLAVKPQSVRFVVASLIPVFDPNKTLLISVAAGITTSQFQRWFGLSDLGMVRAMPNTPALFAQGISGLFATAAVTASQRQMVEALLQTVGETVWIPEESLMDIVTALSGSGPGYFFYFIESLIKGAAELGLPEDIARKLTLQTALGSAYMALHSTDDLGRLREKVTSPGGTTEQGINVLKDGKLGDLLFAALQAAAAHGKSLSEQYN